MKLNLNSFILLLFFACGPVVGEEINKTYIVKVGGIKIGKLSWEILINEKEYVTKLELQSKGILSAIYSFRGRYFSEGSLNNKELISKKYSHFWQTKKTTKNMELVFHDRKLESIKQDPLEGEKLRINVFEIRQTNDPLTSFLQIIMGERNTLVVDGRRIYTMTKKFDENKKHTIIEISNYSNLWADHKRNKFEKIIYEKNPEDFFPSKMFIYYDGRVFRLGS